jgi:hypothetical protein
VMQPGRHVGEDTVEVDNRIRFGHDAGVTNW